MIDDSNQRGSSRVSTNDRHLSQITKDSCNFSEQELNHLHNHLKVFEKQVNQVKYDNIILVRKLIFFIFILFIYSAIQLSELLKKNEFQISQLHITIQQYRNNIIYLQKSIASFRQQINQLHKYTQKLANQIIDLHINQLSKSEKGMEFLKKHSQPLTLKFQEKVKSFIENYKFNKKKNAIRKTSNEQTIIYSPNPIPQDKIFYFSIKIQRTQLGMISFGVFTQEKLRQSIDCGYCKGNQMYYIYCQNGQVYHGETFQYFKHSKKTRFNKIKSGDTITLFIAQQQSQLIWYVNGKFASTQFLQQKMVGQQLYPFILMTNKDDEITLLT